MNRLAEAEMLPACMHYGLGVVPYFPLASGLLTGKYDAGLPEGARLTRVDWLRAGILTEENLRKVRRFKGLAEELGVTRAQLAPRMFAERIVRAAPRGFSLAMRLMKRGTSMCVGQARVQGAS